MSPVMDNEKLKQLAFACTALATRHIYGHTCGDSVIEQAAKLARELFPPMAKALAWDEEPTPFDQGHRYSYGMFCGKTLYQCGMYTDGTHYGHFRVGNELFYAPTREEVKAMCEQHHQARFLEPWDSYYAKTRFLERFTELTL